MFERQGLELTLQEWLVVGLFAMAFLAVAPSISFRPKTPVLEADYRIPYPLSRRYDLYKRYTTLAAQQAPTLLVGDSVIWGQCAVRHETLAAQLNAMSRQPRFVNAGLDGMNPVALYELLQYHAPGIEKSRVLLQFDPLWMMVEEDSAHDVREALYNRADITPRLAAKFTGPFKETVSAAWRKLADATPIGSWEDRFADAKLDFLAWSLEHPYESPLAAISSTLPPSDDTSHLRLTAWNATPARPTSAGWLNLSTSVHWQAFRNILELLEQRGNKVLVVIGPMNEHQMDEPTLAGYRKLKSQMDADLSAHGVRHLVASVLDASHYGDICHPLGPGYAALAKELLQKESAWLFGQE